LSGKRHKDALLVDRANSVHIPRDQSHARNVTTACAPKRRPHRLPPSLCGAKAQFRNIFGKYLAGNCM
jgi:hypothetical protein